MSQHETIGGRWTRRRFLRVAAPLTLVGWGSLLAACQTPTASPTATSISAAKPTIAPGAAASPAVSAPSAPAASPVASPVASPAASPVAAASPAAGWPMYGFDARHTGRSPYAGPKRAVLARIFATAPVLATESGAPRPDIQNGLVVGADGTTYLSNFAGYLFALKDGAASDKLDLAWMFRPTRGGSRHATPAVAKDGTVYHVIAPDSQSPDDETRVHALRAPVSGTDPQVIWTADIGKGRNGISSLAITDDGTVYAVGGEGRLFAIASDGTIKWSVAVGPTLKGSPAIAPDGTAYVPSSDGNLYAAAPPTGSGKEGTVKWKFDFAEHLGPTPLVVNTAPAGPGGFGGGGGGGNGIGSGASPLIAPDGMVYVGANNSNMYAIRPDGQQAWIFEAERELAGIWTTPSLSADGNTIVFGANKGGIYGVNRADGKARWQFNIYGSVYSTGVLDRNGIYYTGSTVGHIFAIDTANGQGVFDFDAGQPVWTAPAIRPDGALVTADRSGRALLLGANS